jgi:hypothetical protein
MSNHQTGNRPYKNCEISKIKTYFFSSFILLTLLDKHLGQARSTKGPLGSKGILNSCPHLKHLKVASSTILISLRIPRSQVLGQEPRAPDTCICPVLRAPDLRTVSGTLIIVYYSHSISSNQQCSFRLSVSIYRHPFQLS